MAHTLISGEPVATSEQMLAYIRLKNKNVSQKILDTIPLYLSVGEAEGIRGDIAFSQSCIETGNFMFIPSQTAVNEAQNNFCGIGVVRYGVKGNSFKTSLEGVTAQIQHLKAYANNEPLNLPCVDPRFNLVKRGSARYVEWLGINENPNKCGWAGGTDYGGKILRVLNAILAINTEDKIMYHVRKSWDDGQSQAGAFENLDNAKKCCDKHSGYSVFDNNGNAIYKKKSDIENVFEIGVNLYDWIAKNGCEHSGGANTVLDIMKKRKTTCTNTLTAILKEAGIINNCGSISHTKAVGGGALNILKNKNSIQKSMTGYKNLDKNKCEIIYLGCLNFSTVPSKYKMPGAIFIQDSNGFMYQGKDKNGQDINRSCNNDKSKQLKKDKNGVYRYYNNTMTSGYTFNSPILVAIIPNRG